MKILLFKEKHDDRYFLMEKDDTDNINKIFLKLFKERNKDGQYEIRDPEHEKYYSIAIDPSHKNQARAAKLFMINRCDYEYEGFESITPETSG